MSPAVNAQPVRAVNPHADVLGPETERDNVNDHITRRYRDEEAAHENDSWGGDYILPWFQRFLQFLGFTWSLENCGGSASSKSSQLQLTGRSIKPIHQLGNYPSSGPVGSGVYSSNMNKVGGGVYSGGQSGYSGSVSGVNNNIKDLTQVDVMLPDMDQDLAALPQKFSDTDAKKVFYRTSVFLSVPLITLLLFAGFDVYQALSHSPEVKRYEMRILQGMKIGNLMTEILREQSFTFKYVMDRSHGNLNKLQHAQIETDKRINELYRTGFPEYLTVTNPQEYILYTAMGKGFVESETDNLQISNTSLNFLQKRDDVLEKFREIRVPPSTSAAINNLTLHVNSFYTKVMEILVQSVVYTFSEEPALFGTRKWKMLVAFKCLLEIQSRAAKIDAIGMFFYTEGYADAEKVQLMVANQAVEDYCFSKILMYVPDLKSDTDRLSDAIDLLRGHRYRILNNQSLEASKSMGINWIAVISLYNEQLKTVQNILGRAMLNNIDDFRRNANMLIGITVTALIFIALVEPFLFWANINKTYSLVKVQTQNTVQLTKLTEVLSREKQRSDDLIYKLVPADIAKKLKNHITVTPEIFDSVSVLYADIVNFTLISSYHSATEVVNLLNYLFCLIDKLTDKYDAFKADTVGDAYVAVTGLPTCGSKATSESVTNIAHLALDMLGQIQNLDHENESMCEVKLRIGLATGPVSVGMIGMKIPKYCVFGETVNLATAMEERSQAMRILITNYTRNFLADTGIFETLFRGQFKIEDTIIDTYWLVGSSLLDSRLDIFSDNKPKKRDGVLQRRMKQREMEVQPRRRPYDSASAVPSKVAFKVEQIPIATTKTEEVESEEAAPDEHVVEEEEEGEESEEGEEGEEGEEREKGNNISEEFTSLTSTSFTVKDHDANKAAESFTVKVGGEGGLDPEGAGDWQTHQSTGHGVSEESLVPVS
ncbi:uncharacterized protein LOC134821388 [Bolinopsis microptera]|uniref:uncharacterized protein LOC134821388 n=1 Tax=Bolinopsis microptera TaxID=2820187 RepID=UPI00307A3424